MHPYDAFQEHDGRLGDGLRGWAGARSEMPVAWTQVVAAGRKRRAQMVEIFKETGAEGGWPWWLKGRAEHP